MVTGGRMVGGNDESVGPIGSMIHHASASGAPAQSIQGAAGLLSDPFETLAVAEGVTRTIPCVVAEAGTLGSREGSQHPQVGRHVSDRGLLVERQDKQGSSHDQLAVNFRA